MVDVICIGNAIIDAFLSIHEANEHCRINRETGEWSIKAGEKVPLDSASFHLGGNACNVSVGLSRLGLKSALVAEIGDEAFSYTIRHTLERENVNTSHLQISHAPSSFAVGINFKQERTLFVHHVERHHNFAYEGLHGKWVYLSSMGEKWRHVYREVPALTNRIDAKLAFNPGTRQIEAGYDAIAGAMEASDILFVNLEEGVKIAKSDHHQIRSANYKEEIRKVLTLLQRMGPKTVVLTDGDHGAFCLDETGTVYHEPIRPAPVVERTGAGDAFATGFLAAIVYEHTIPEALAWGSANATGVIGKVGAQPGLLTKEQMENMV